ncbi:hypothetical protein C0995_013890 [Termitomyces sp. Mi166|nr:hypothetical protein C0995_013890 [Termitomyces sp. Mi166\
MIKNWVALLQTVGEVYRQPTADEISEPLNIFIDGALLKVKSVSWSTTSTVSQPPVQLKMEDTGEAHLHALRERFEPTRQARQKRVDVGKDKPRKLSEDDFLQLRQAWQQEFADIVNGTKEELPPWREVNHEINLIDESRQYFNAKWWEPWAAMQAAPLLCISKKDGTL